MKPDAMRKMEVEEIVRGGGQGGVAVVRVPASGGEEGCEDMVHEALHLGSPFMVEVALSQCFTHVCTLEILYLISHLKSKLRCMHLDFCPLLESGQCFDRPKNVYETSHPVQPHPSLSPLFRRSAHLGCNYIATMSFARTFLRTSRALRTQSSNPIQCALGSRGSQQFVNRARCYATVFERNKPHVNIGTIGHVDHGKVGSLKGKTCSSIDI